NGLSTPRRQYQRPDFRWVGTKSLEGDGLATHHVRVLLGHREGSVDDDEWNASPMERGAAALRHRRNPEQRHRSGFTGEMQQHAVGCKIAERGSLHSGLEAVNAVGHAECLADEAIER